MHKDMNKGMRSIFLTIYSLFAIALIAYNLDGLALGITRTDGLILIGVFSLLVWIAMSNMFDAFDGVKNCIDHHILHKTPCE